MQTIDLMQQHREYYRAANNPEIVHIEGGRFLSMLGSGAPGSELFYKRKTALTSLMFEVEKLCSQRGLPFAIAPLEISYWNPKHGNSGSIGDFYTAHSLDELEYRMMFRIPDFVLLQDLELAEQNSDSSDRPRRFCSEIFTMEDRTVLQILHKGPFAHELETMRQMQLFAEAQGVRKFGPHHEIHLTDWEKGQPQEHLETILRDPVEKIPTR